MKLYGSLASAYVARVAMAARLKGIDLETAFPPGGNLKSPEYLRINPLGKIPALEDGGRHVIESGVILEYLEDRFPAKPLLPADPFERARVRTLARFVDLYLQPPVYVLGRNANPATRDAAAVEAAKASANTALAYFEPYLVGPYAAGSAPTLADCVMFPTFEGLQNRVATAHGLGDALAAYPKLSAWWKTMQNDAVCTTLTREIDAAVKDFMARMAAAAQAKS
jgi:glutathione S-transferase